MEKTQPDITKFLPLRVECLERCHLQKYLECTWFSPCIECHFELMSSVDALINRDSTPSCGNGNEMPHIFAAHTDDVQ